MNSINIYIDYLLSGTGQYARDNKENKENVIPLCLGEKNN